MQSRLQVYRVLDHYLLSGAFTQQRNIASVMLNYIIKCSSDLFAIISVHHCHLRAYLNFLSIWGMTFCRIMNKKYLRKYSCYTWHSKCLVLLLAYCSDKPAIVMSFKVKLSATSCIHFNGVHYGFVLPLSQLYRVHRFCNPIMMFISTISVLGMIIIIIITSFVSRCVFRNVLNDSCWTFDF